MCLEGMGEKQTQVLRVFVYADVDFDSYLQAGLYRDLILDVVPGIFCTTPSARSANRKFCTKPAPYLPHSGSRRTKLWDVKREVQRLWRSHFLISTLCLARDVHHVGDPSARNVSGEPCQPSRGVAEYITYRHVAGKQ